MTDPPASPDQAARMASYGEQRAERLAAEQGLLAELSWDELPAAFHDPETCIVCDAVRAEIERRTRP